ncbi:MULTISPECIES: sugar porter family MFS transporter [Acidiplasma]|jgi:SP family arabinose:H+ symporter-like MFS transporter|nr:MULTISPECIES: sugar porter family MFS transporter [Acidiplasma]WMT54994.1 MAG: sugar porter family MFS transporter [Acidiplasma sp.]
METQNLPDSDPILNEMNSKITTKFYWAVTVLATIGGFLFGYDTSNIGTDLGFIPFAKHLATTAPFVYGYLIAGASLGAAVGALIAAALTDKYGRKFLLITDAAIYTIGALLSAAAVNLAMLLISRTFIGLAVGADSAIATAYIVEYAPKRRRGHLSLMQQWMITWGILGAYLVGMGVFFIAPGLAYAVDWRILLGVAAIPSIIGLIFRFYMPESPRWLILHEKYDKAISALKRFNINATEDQLTKTHGVLQSMETKMRATPGIKRAFVVVGLFMMFQQITGINVPFYYGPTVIAKLNIFGSAGGSYLSKAVFGIEASSILAVINVLATLIGFKLIDSYGRRSLALLGYSGMALFDFIGTVLYLDHIAVGLLIGFAGFIIFFAFAVGGTGWLLQGEYFPTQYRGLYASLIAVVDWISNFAIIEIFPAMNLHIGLGYTMAVFGVLSVIAVIIFFFIMPETKGISVEEVTEMFENNTLLNVKNASGTRESTGSGDK